MGYEHPSMCENLLAGFYEIIELAVRGNYSFAKKCYEYSDNDIIKLTKRLLLGKFPDDDMPSQLLQDGDLPFRLFQFLSSMAESGLIEVSHYISVLNVKSYHQNNLREIGDKLSKEIIRTQTLIDNPIPVKMSKLDLKAVLNQDKIQMYREAYKNGDKIMAKEISESKMEDAR